MKKLILTLLLIMPFYVQAQSYVELYGSTVVSTTNNTVELNYANNSGIILFGVTSGGQAGAKADMFFNNVGVGASLGGYVETGILELSAGLITLSDKSEGGIPNSGRVTFKNDRSNEMGNGVYIGAKFKMVSIRLIRYDVAHSYRASTKIGHRHVKGKKIPVFATGSSKADITRDLVWIGVTFPF